MSNYEVNINRKKLEKACRSLFDAGLLEVRMKYDKDENGERIDKNVLVNSFMDVVDEIVKVGKREDLPVLAVEIYNTRR